MTTNHIKFDYDYNRNNNKWKNYSHLISNNNGLITNRSKHGPYNITEKDFGDHKVHYYIPSSYEKDYDMSQLDEEPLYEEQQKYYSPVIVRRRYYQSYDDDDDNDYIEELPMISPRRNTYVLPRRPQVIKRVYYDQSPPPPPPSQITEYIYEDNYRPKNEEITEYIVRDRVPRQKYIEESQSTHRTTYVENLPPISRSPRASPSPRSTKPLQPNELFSPRRSKLKQQTPRITPMYETPRKLISHNNNQQKHMSLKDVLAQNRARRGSRIPKPRREVDEEQLYDPPTYNKNFIKNDFIVHK